MKNIEISQIVSGCVRLFVIRQGTSGLQIAEILTTKLLLFIYTHKYCMYEPFSVISNGLIHVATYSATRRPFLVVQSLLKNLRPSTTFGQQVIAYRIYECFRNCYDIEMFDLYQASQVFYLFYAYLKMYLLSILLL